MRQLALANRQISTRNAHAAEQRTCVPSRDRDARHGTNVSPIRPSPRSNSGASEPGPGEPSTLAEPPSSGESDLPQGDGDGDAKEEEPEKVTEEEDAETETLASPHKRQIHIPHGAWAMPNSPKTDKASPQKHAHRGQLRSQNRAHLPPNPAAEGADGRNL